MVQATNGNKVRVHYTGRLDDGTVFDSSRGGEPLEFTIGEHHMIPGFEQGVIGMEPGQTKTVLIPPEQAYGPHNPEKVIEVARSQLPTGMPLEIGMRLQGSPPGRRPVEFTVVGVTESVVTLDGNHPMAGKNLTFDIQLQEIV
jgi:FKBP-type peptidyl-prolyl cis-trans isomerase 2